MRGKAYAHIAMSVPHGANLLPVLSLLPALQIVNHSLWTLIISNDGQESSVEPSQSIAVDFLIENSEFSLALQTEKGTL